MILNMALALFFPLLSSKESNKCSKILVRDRIEFLWYWNDKPNLISIKFIIDRYDKSKLIWRLIKKRNCKSRTYNHLINRIV